MRCRTATLRDQARPAARDAVDGAKGGRAVCLAGMANPRTCDLFVPNSAHGGMTKHRATSASVVTTVEGAGGSWRCCTSWLYSTSDDRATLVAWLRSRATGALRRPAWTQSLTRTSKTALGALVFLAELRSALRDGSRSLRCRSGMRRRRISKGD
jgi:hypothetical protein